VFSEYADPYLNGSAGTTPPFKHGETFMLDDDGGEVLSTDTGPNQIL
jgi:CTP synthase (UTP-ammonia lyase)